MKTIVNSSLLLVLVTIMVMPLLGASVLITYDTQSLGAVAGVRTLTPRDVNVLPNLTEFGDYVKFAPAELTNNIYRDTISLTVFQRQKASYRGLYSIYNLSEREPMTVEVVTTGGDLVDDSYESLVGMLSRAGESINLNTDLKTGETIVPISDVSGFTEGEVAFIGDEMVNVVVINSEATGVKSIIVTPLKREHKVGELITPQAIVIKPGQLVYPQTRKMLLAPGERVQLDFEVQGTASLIKKDQLVSLPIEIRINKN